MGHIWTYLELCIINGLYMDIYGTYMDINGYKWI